MKKINVLLVILVVVLTLFWQWDNITGLFKKGDNIRGVQIGRDYYLPNKTSATTSKAAFQFLNVTGRVGLMGGVTTSTITVPTDAANLLSLKITMTSSTSPTATLSWSYWFSDSNTPRDWYPESTSSGTIKVLNIISPGRVVHSWTPSVSNFQTTTKRVLLWDVAAKFTQIRFRAQTASTSIHVIVTPINVSY